MRGIDKMVKETFLLLFYLILTGSVCIPDAFCQQVRPVERVNESGDVHGMVECPRGTPREGVLVHILDHSFMVRTDRQGSFILYNVPESFYPYSLIIEPDPGSTFRIDDVIVRGNRITDLGTIVACSGGCEDNSSCPNGYYCQKAVGDCDGKGVCAARPPGVFRYRDPVCGCDGITYMNKERAAKEGISLAWFGPCEGRNSCQDNTGCLRGYYCAKQEGNCDGVGVCTRKPTAWIELYAPVCGCDGKTYYSNSAEAAGHGVNIAYQGECGEE